MRYTDNGAEDIKIAYIGGGLPRLAWGYERPRAAQDMSGRCILYDIDREAAARNECIGNKMKDLKGMQIRVEL